VTDHSDLPRTNIMLTSPLAEGAMRAVDPCRRTGCGCGLAGSRSRSCPDPTGSGRWARHTVARRHGGSGAGPAGGPPSECPRPSRFSGRRLEPTDQTCRASRPRQAGGWSYCLRRVVSVARPVSSRLPACAAANRPDPRWAATGRMP
jgi:hypothetical protein